MSAASKKITIGSFHLRQMSGKVAQYISSKSLLSNEAGWTPAKYGTKAKRPLDCASGRRLIEIGNQSW
jgi:hypothetical protein